MPHDICRVIRTVSLAPLGRDGRICVLVFYLHLSVRLRHSCACKKRGLHWTFLFNSYPQHVGALPFSGRSFQRSLPSQSNAQPSLPAASRIDSQPTGQPPALGPAYSRRSPACQRTRFAANPPALAPPNPPCQPTGKPHRRPTTHNHGSVSANITFFSGLSASANQSCQVASLLVLNPWPSYGRAP